MIRKFLGLVVIALLLMLLSGCTAAPRVEVVEIIPADKAADVSVYTGVVITLKLPEDGSGIDINTLNTTTLTFQQADTQTAVPASITAYGRDSITLQPLAALAPNTGYTLTLTENVKDKKGNALKPYTLTFTTGATPDGEPVQGIAFEQMDAGATAENGYTGLTFGPDNRLYAVNHAGQVFSWQVNEDGKLSDERVFPLFEQRVLIGLKFDPASTPDNLLLWVTSNFAGLTDAPNFSSEISRIDSTDGGETWTRTDYIVGLPRSIRDHLTNSIDFGSDGLMYVTQGSISAAGAPDVGWGNQVETLLSGSLLQIDTALLQAYVEANGKPLDVATGDAGADGKVLVDRNFGLGDSHLSATNTDLDDPEIYYNPMLPDAPVKIYATGLRNPYDLVWHSNGFLYSPVNGTAGGGRTPETPNPLPATCENRLDTANGTYTSPAVPATKPPAQNDWLFLVEQGGYYGQPNPLRCEWVLNGGNPTDRPDPGQTGDHYPVGTQPDRNWRGATAYDFGLNKSPNGIIEYQSDVFDNKLAGGLMVVRYSLMDDILVLKPGEDGTIAEVIEGIPGFVGLRDPLDLIEDTRNGNLYVAEYAAGTIMLLRPQDDPKVADTSTGYNPAQSGQRPAGNTGTMKLPGGFTTRLDGVGGDMPVRLEQGPAAPDIAVTPALVTMQDDNGGGVGPNRAVQITNNGTAPLTINCVIAAPFSLAAACPASVTAGATVTVNVRYQSPFVSPAGGVSSGTLTINSNDPDTPQTILQLRGLGKPGGGGAAEPSLQRIFDAFGLPINTGDDDPATNQIHSSLPLATSGQLGPDEIRIQSFEKAGPGPVTFQPLTAWALNPANAAVPVVTIGWHPTGNATLNPVMTIANGSAATVNPATGGSLTFDPGAAKFGIYAKWDHPTWAGRVTSTEDALNVFAGAYPHHARIYPYTNPAGVTEPNAFIVAYDEATTGQDFNDVVFIVRNVRLATPAGEGRIRFENRDWSSLNLLGIPQLNYLNTWLSFSKVHAVNHRSHENVTLRIHNDGGTPLVLTRMTVSDTVRFDLVNNEDAPGWTTTIAPGGFYDLQVRYVESINLLPPSAGPERGISASSATLTIPSSDPTNPVQTVQLRSLGQRNSGGNTEPTYLQIIQHAFGITSNIPANMNSAYTQQGEEVLSYYWRATGNQVYGRFLAAYQGCPGGSTRLDFLAVGGGTNRASPNYDNQSCQSILPFATTPGNNGTAPTEIFFTPNSPAYNLAVAGYRTNRCEGIAGCTEHGYRLWPYRTPSGQIVPNTYVAIQDFVAPGCGAGIGGGGNCDYQDHVMLITGIEPVNVPPPDFTVNKTVSSATTPLGSNYNYTVTVTNNLIFQAPNMVMTDVLPAGLNFVSATPSQGTCTFGGGTVTCNLGNLLGQQTATITITVAPTTAGEKVNTVNVTSSAVTRSATVINGVIDPANQPGTITVIKEATPETNTVFNFTTTGGLNNFTLADNGTGTGPQIQTHVNFGNSTTAPATFNLGDNGAAYTPARGYGWVTEGTRNDANPVGSVNTQNARVRTTSVLGPEYNSLNHVQGTTSSDPGGIPVPRAWIMNVPNGPYQITVAVGDPDNINSTHRININGTVVINNFIPPGGFPNGAAERHRTTTVNLNVTNGRIVVDSIGGTNTKINFIRIVGGPTIPGNTRIFNYVLPGTYDITETAIPIGWNLSNIVCNTGVTNITNGVRLTLASNQNIICTFNNQQITGPAIDIQKTPDTQDAALGGTVTFTITVTNLGNVTLNNVTVTDPLAPNCDRNLGTMLTTAVQTYTCTSAPITANMTNTATVTGTPAAGAAPTDFDTANVVLVNAALTINKTPDTQTLNPGATANFTVTVTNSGIVPLANVTVADPLAPACNRNIGAMLPGATTTYNCALANIPGTFTNVATVTGALNGGSLVTASDTALVVSNIVYGPATYRVNVGGPQLTAADGGVVWSADTANVGAPGAYPFLVNNMTISGSGFTGTNATNAPTALFGTARFDGTNNAIRMQYNFTGLTAGQQYEVRLFFAENNFTAANARQFHVDIAGTRVLTNFDTFAAALAQTGNGRNAIRRDFPVTVGAGGNILVDFFHGAVNNPTVRGIEIVPITTLLTSNLGVNPTIVDFGTVIVNTTGTAQNITLTNLGVVGAPNISITDIAAAGATGQFTVNPLGAPGIVIAPQTNNTTLVTNFAPTTEGVHQVTLTLTHDGANGPTSTVTLRGTAVIPDLVFAPNPLVFNIDENSADPTATLPVNLTQTFNLPTNATIDATACPFVTGVTPPNGAVPASGGGNLPVQVTVNRTGLTPGPHTCILRATAPGYDPAQVTVTLNVTAADYDIQIINNAAQVTVNPAGPLLTVPSGANQAFTFTPQPGFIVTDVRLNGTSLGAITNYTLNNITSDYVLEVLSGPIPVYNLTVNVFGNGIVRPPTGADITTTAVLPFTQGQTPTFNFTPAAGWRIDRVVTTDSAGTAVNRGAIALYNVPAITANGWVLDVHFVQQTPATLMIVKEATPEGATPFAFNVTGPNGFAQNFNIIDDGILPPAFAVNVNFSGQLDAVPAGYLLDYGLSYRAQNGQTYGWVTQASIAAGGPGVPTNMNSLGRDRGFSPGIPQELDTYMHMQYAAFNPAFPNAAWEIVVPNGLYEITVSVGDVLAPNNNSTHVINVEGQNFLTFAQAGANGTLARTRQATQTLAVTDGRVTVDAIGGTNTKINYIQIRQIVTTNNRQILSLVPGTYNIAETLQLGWNLTAINCTTGLTDVVTGTASLNLAEGATATCTFNNAAVPVDAVNDTYLIAEGALANIPAAQGVLLNDFPTTGLTSTVATPPVGVTGFALNPDGSFTFQHPAGSTTPITFTYTATDTVNNDVATVVVNILAAVNDTYTVITGQTLLTAAPGFLGNDVIPPGVTVALVDNVDNGILTFNADGSFTYAPNAGFLGVDTFQYSVTINGVTDTATVTINVNPPVVVANDDAYTTTEDTALNVPVPGILVNDTVPATPINITIMDNVDNGTLVMNPNGSFTYTPNANFAGTDTFVYQIDDGGTNFDSATVTITVTPVNDVPVAVADAYTMTQATILSIAAPGILGNDTDPDNPVLLVVAATGHSGNPAWLTVNADGSFFFAPDAAFAGVYTFNYTVTDGIATSAPATVTITVNPLSSVAATNDAYSVNQGQTLLTAAPGILANDIYPVGGVTLTVTDNVDNGTLTTNNDGSFTYTPNVGFTGTDTFTYQIVNGADVATAIVTITVNPLPAPVAVNDVAVVAAGTTVNVNVAANDTFAPGALTVTIVTAPAEGTAVVNGQNIDYTAPAVPTLGSVTLTYNIRDVTTNTSNVATVTIVQNVNAPSLFVSVTPNTQTVAAGMPVTFNINIRNNGNTNLTGISFVITNSAGLPETCIIPAFDLAIGADQNFTCTDAAAPATDYTRTFTASDGAGVVVAGTTVQVLIGGNAPPIAADDVLQTNKNQAIDIPVALNDVDPENALNLGSVVHINDPFNGFIVSINPITGTIRVQPGTDYVGSLTFNYTICDMAGLCDVAAITLNVVDAPGSAPAGVQLGPDGQPLPPGVPGTGAQVAGAVAGNPQITIFDPGLSKIGLLLPGQLGVNGEAIEWVIVVRNTGTVTGTNVVVTDVLRSELRVDRAITSKGSASVSGQTVTFSLGDLAPGEAVQMSVFTTVLRGGVEVDNTATVTADNIPGGQTRAVTARVVTTLPRTGESPWSPIRIILIVALVTVVMTISIVAARSIRRRQYR